MDNGLDTGAIIAIVSILMVFVVLMLIIALTEMASKAISSVTNEEEETKAAPTVTTAPAPVSAAGSPLDINDEDATVAALVASIDYREETGKNIRVVSVKKVG